MYYIYIIYFNYIMDCGLLLVFRKRKPTALIKITFGRKIEAAKQS